MPKVSIVKCNDYNDAELAVRRSIDLLGGIKKFVEPGFRVLLKPNFLTSKYHNGIATTNPAVLRAAAVLVHEAGGKIIIGDSPALEPAGKVIKKFGYDKILADLPVVWAEFNESVLLDKSRENIGKEFPHKLELARIYKDVDLVLNLPKLKTHCQMKMTLAVKNLFGFVVGKRKAQWHFKAGENKNIFARMLLEIYMQIRPGLSIMDGITAMHRNGPSNGEPFETGLILASDDALSMDAVIAEIVGLPVKSFYMLFEAKKLGLTEIDLDKIDILGEDIDDCRVDGFEFPEVIDVEFGPRFLRAVLRNALTSRPKFNTSRCKACMECAKICPADAITRKGDHVVFDEKKCLRCFCCQEICPHNAIGIKQGFLSWLAK